MEADYDLAKNLPGLGVAPEELADHLRKMSNGRLDIKVYGAGEVGRLKFLMPFPRALRRWAMEQPIIGAAKFPPRNVRHRALWHERKRRTAIASWWRFGAVARLYAPFNLVPFAAGNSGVQMAG